MTARILELLADHCWYSPYEVAYILRINESTTHRILGAMAYRGMLHARPGAYRLAANRKVETLEERAAK